MTMFERYSLSSIYSYFIPIWVGYMDSGDIKTCIFFENWNKKFFKVTKLPLTIYYKYRYVIVKIKPSPIIKRKMYPEGMNNNIVKY